MRRFLLLLPLLALGCEPAPQVQPQFEPPPVVLPASVTELTPDAAERFLVEHPTTQLMDLRTEAERKEYGQMPHALSFDWLVGEATMKQVAQLDKTKPCLVYCTIGGRARLMAAEMVTMGFTEIHLLKGGFNAWVAAGKAVSK